MPVASIHSFAYKPLPHQWSLSNFSTPLSLSSLPHPYSTTHKSSQDSHSLSYSFFLEREQVKMTAGQPYTHHIASSHHLGLPGIGCHHPYFRRSSRFRCHQSRKVSECFGGAHGTNEQGSVTLTGWLGSVMMSVGRLRS